MSYQLLTVGPDWSPTPQYTASGETSIAIINSYGSRIFWITTLDDVVPVLATRRARPIQPGGTADVTLADTERLWIVAPFITDPNVEITLML